jgi:hypothetical protein
VRRSGMRSGRLRTGLRRSLRHRGRHALRLERRPNLRGGRRGRLPVLGRHRRLQWARRVLQRRVCGDLHRRVPDQRGRSMLGQRGSDLRGVRRRHVPRLVAAERVCIGRNVRRGGVRSDVRRRHCRARRALRSSHHGGRWGLPHFVSPLGPVHRSRAQLAGAVPGELRRRAHRHRRGCRHVLRGCRRPGLPR